MCLQRNAWVDAIRRAAGPPLDPKAPSKREMNSPGKQLQEAIRKDMEDSDKRHKEADQAELGYSPVIRLSSLSRTFGVNILHVFVARKE